MNDHTNPEIPEEESTQVGMPDSTPELSLELSEVKRVLEAALLSSTEPLTVQQLKRLFSGEIDADNIRKVLDELRAEWAERPVELTSVA
ncbi:MAG TPA: SMC-Scp complex subunit ScpB, partial [Usitatibacter sp.]|nr:SMC-Scp complex subunit ScpB [Usitatibacter sp.]